MDSSFCLRYCSLSSLPLCVPSTVNFSRANKPHFSFHSSSLSLSKSSRSGPIRHIPSPITCATNGSNGFSRSATNDKGDNNIARGTVRVSLAMACVLGIIGCSYTLKHKAHAFPPIGSPWGAETATTKANRFIDQMDRGVAPSKIDEQLKNTFMENPEEAYNVQMELIRIHINRGKYDEASRHCEDLSKKEIYYSRYFRTDQRYHLYKGIVYAMWYKNDVKAKECFQKYIDILDASPKLG
ncbi:hypothetical protein PVL29_013244 [Vitis rotundifolia]|uniref:Uncharacterized protein n=1 Tax=Vitis rotundifolia TaxID=103349 RepID=A0AA39DNB8_VITRO|nr:hypothetical protein PVL29_013244 [Vitis rotundifolia]